MNLPESRGGVEVSGLAFSYTAGQQVFHGLDFCVPAGESLALMGVSGSGKSTLLRCLAGLETPRCGTVRIGALEMSGSSPSRRARQRLTSIGVVTQAGDLLPELSVHENVALPLLLSGVPRREAFARARRALDALGVGGLAPRGTWEVSGGQYHRVAIARALVIEPSVLLGDEPTGALDAETATEVVDLLLGATAQSVAVVIATHDPRVAARCDRVAHLSDGRLTFEAA